MRAHRGGMDYTGDAISAWLNEFLGLSGRA